MKNSFADKVRQALINLGGGVKPVSNDTLAEYLDLVGDRDKRPMYMALRDLCRSGEAQRVAPGRHLYKGKTGGPDIRSAMWSVLRMRKTVNLDDLQELAGASRHYASQFMILLVRRGVVERIRRGSNWIYRLVQDPGPQTPEDNEKAAALRRLREAKKAAIEQMDVAGRALIDATQALVRARMVINDIPEEAGDGNE